MHNADRMGWRVGDRISVSSTEGFSQGESQSFFIQSLGPALGQVNLASNATGVPGNIHGGGEFTVANGKGFSKSSEVIKAVARRGHHGG